MGITKIKSVDNFSFFFHCNVIMDFTRAVGFAVFVFLFLFFSKTASFQKPLAHHKFCRLRNGGLTGICACASAKLTLSRGRINVKRLWPTCVYICIYLACVVHFLHSIYYRRATPIIVSASAKKNECAYKVPIFTLNSFYYTINFQLFLESTYYILSLK